VAAVRDLDATWWSARTDGELVTVVEQVQARGAALAGFEAGAIAEADARGLAKAQLCYGSTGDWLTHLGGLRKGEGRRLVGRGPGPTGPPTPPREAIARAPALPG